MREVREGLEQLLGVRVPRRPEEGGGIVLLGHPTAVHDHDPIADLCDDAEIVGDQDDAHPEVTGDPAQQLQDLGLDHHVEGGRRLIGNDDIGVAGQRQGDHRALPHAARVGVGILVRAPAADPHPLQELGGASGTLVLRGARCVQTASAWHSWRRRATTDSWSERMAQRGARRWPAA